MALEQVIDELPLLSDQQKSELRERLQDFPKNVEKWLYASIDPTTLYQGDILLDLLVSFIDEDGEPVAGISHVSLMSNTCDMWPGRGEFCTVSPIIPLSHFGELEKAVRGDERAVEDTMDAIRRNQVYPYFYLPAKNALPESFIDFSQMVSIKNAYLGQLKETYPGRYVLSLSHYGFLLFITKLAHFFLRLENPARPV